MTTHHHKHTHESKPDLHHKIDLSGIHKDWRTWLVIGIMLMAIGTYVLTLDDSSQSGGAVQNSTSPASAPAIPSK